MAYLKHVAWLSDQLPKLIEAGALTPAIADQVRRYYQDSTESHSYQEAEGRGRNVALTMFSVIGALLIGGGVILLLAHNWQELSRTSRTAIALLPLVACQGLAAWTLLRQKGTAWRESVATLWVLALGAGLALIEQTYHIPGDYETFLLRWALLALPAVWLLRSMTATILYLIGITIWAPFALSSQDSSVGYWPLLAAVLPFFWRRYKKAPNQPSTVLVTWFVGISLLVGLPLSVSHVLEELWPTVFALLFASFLLIGRLVSDANTSAIQRPFRMLGFLGTLGLAVTLSYEEPWRSVNRLPARLSSLFTWENLLPLTILLALLVAVGYLVFLALTRSQSASGERRVLPLSEGFWLALPLLVFVASFTPGTMSAPLMINVYLLLLGVVCIARGFATGSLRYNNLGMSILSILLVLRFFDSDLDMALRGLSFIAVGLGFFLTNWILVRGKAKP